MARSIGGRWFPNPPPPPLPYPCACAVAANSRAATATPIFNDKVPFIPLSPCLRTLIAEFRSHDSTHTPDCTSFCARFNLFSPDASILIICFVRTTTSFTCSPRTTSSAPVAPSHWEPPATHRYPRRPTEIHLSPPRS